MTVRAISRLEGSGRPDPGEDNRNRRFSHHPSGFDFRLKAEAACLRT
jgi:hypothetical protein